MAYYLENPNAGNTRVNTAQTVTLSNVGDYVEYKGFANSGNPSSNWRLIGNSGDYSNLVELTTNSLTVQFSGGGFNTLAHNAGIALGEVFTVRLEKIATDTWEYFLNGSSFGTVSEGNPFQFNQLMAFNDAAFDEAFRGALYYVEAGTSGGTTHLWEASASNGTGSTLPDTIGTNDGTLVNFPTDDSQWVFYDDGSAGGDEAGDITSAASSTDSWAAQVQSAVSLTSSAAASDQATAIASVNLSIMEAAQATDVTGDAPAAVGSMTDAATGNDTVDALAGAAAAISAGASAGESWTVQAQVLVNLVEEGAAADEIRRQTESAVTAALEAQSLASDQFIASLDTIASLSDSASVTDAYQAVVLQLASIASGAVASDSFRMLFGLQRAIQEAALADASFSISYAFVNALRSGGLSGDAWALMANLNASLSDVCSVADLMSVRASTTARLTAGAIASSSFAIVNAGVRYLIMGAVILRDALQYRVNTKPALNQSVKIKPGH